MAICRSKIEKKKEVWKQTFGGVASDSLMALMGARLFSGTVALHFSLA